MEQRCSRLRAAYLVTLCNILHAWTTFAEYSQPETQTLYASLTVPLRYSRNESLRTSLRVRKATLEGCNDGGLDASPIAVSNSVECPCFLSYEVFASVDSVWDIFFLEENDWSDWRGEQYDGNPESYVEKYSVVGRQVEAQGYGLSLGETNILLAGAYRLVFRPRAPGVVCFFTPEDEEDAELYRNYVIFEEMPKACPVLVPNQPKAQKRIVGGTEAEESSQKLVYFPWMVSIWHRQQKAICGGSHIAPGYVLTAAHCDIQRDISSYMVRIGGASSDSGKAFQIRKVWVHESYRILDSGDVINDVALLQVANRDESKDKDIVSLNTDVNSPAVGDYVTAAGYGHISQGWSTGLEPDRLRKVDIEVWDPEICSETFQAVTREMHICAGIAEGGCDSCQADSGGPLRYIRVNETGGRETVLAGIVSFGSGCAKPDIPGVYVNVTTYVPWIQTRITSDRDGSSIPPTRELKNESLFSNTWVVVLLCALLVLSVIALIALGVYVAQKRGQSEAGVIDEENAAASDVPSTTGISA